MLGRNLVGGVVSGAALISFAATSMATQAPAPKAIVTHDVVLCVGETALMRPSSENMRRTHAQTTDPSVASVVRVSDNEVALTGVHPGRAKARIHALVQSKGPSSDLAKSLHGYEPQTFIYKITVVEDCQQKQTAVPEPGPERDANQQANGFSDGPAGDPGQHRAERGAVEAGASPQVPAKNES